MQCAADRSARDITNRVDGIDIRDRHLVGEKRLARKHEGLGGERRVRIGLAQRGGQRIDEPLLVSRSE